MQDDDIIKDEGEVDDLDLDLAGKKKIDPLKIDPLIDPLDDAESIDDIEEEEEAEDEPFDDVNPI